MFLQIHYLTSYHASLLNRDEAGLAKRIVFGGAPRLRVSSQCQKRHWRQWLIKQSDLPGGIRSRHFFSRVIYRRLVEEEGVDSALATSLILELAKALLVAAGEKKPLDQETLEMKQPVLFGKPEADYLIRLLKEAAETGDENSGKELLKERLKKGKKNFKAMTQQAGLEDPGAGIEGAMFGRFVTSDILGRVDAPVHVAHAFTTHALDTEVDYFTVVDDLAEDETGAAHANDMELGTGLFYGYVAIDVPLLVSNLTGVEPEDWKAQDNSETKKLINLFVQSTAQVTPGAKLGATAPYARAEYLMLEAGETQPRSLANAFLEPVRFNGKNPMALSGEAMASYIDAEEKMYGSYGANRYIATLHQWPRAQEKVLSMAEATERALSDIFEGAAE